jgi:hypothetical protein
MKPNRSGFSRGSLFLGLLAAAALAAAWTLSPRFMTAHFSTHLKLSDYIIFRIGLLRVALACVPAVLAAYVFVPAQKRQEIFSALDRWGSHPAAAIGSWLLLAVFLWTETLIYEGEPNVEGIFAYGAVRVMKGEVPCLDFFTYVPPAFFYFLSALYKIFGASLSVARYGSVIIPKFLTAAILYHISRFFLPRKNALAITLLCGILMSANALSAEIHASSLALLFALSTLPPLLYFFRTGRAYFLIISGLLAAATALIKQDYGVYILAGNLAGLAVGLSAGHVKGARVRSFAYYLLSWAGLLGIAAAAFLAKTPVPLLRECYIQGPLAYMQHFSNKGQMLIPFMGLVRMLQGEISPGLALFQLARFDAQLLIVFTAALFGSNALFQEWRKKRGLDQEAQGLGVLILCMLAFLGHVFKGGSQSNVGCGVLSVVIWGALIDRWRRMSPQLPRHRSLRWAGIAALAYYGFIVLFFRPLTPPSNSTWLHTPSGELRCLTPQDASELAAAIGHVRSNTQPDERIFLYTTDINNGYTFFHFLAQRDSGTRYHELFAGISTTLEAQRRIISDLGDNQVRWIVETPGTTTGIAEGPLYLYVQSRYGLAAKFGKFKILKRRS